MVANQDSHVLDADRWMVRRLRSEEQFVLCAVWIPRSYIHLTLMMLKREECVDFAHMMEDIYGLVARINKLSIYINGYVKYLQDTGEYRVDVSGFSGVAAR